MASAKSSYILNPACERDREWRALPPLLVVGLVVLYEVTGSQPAFWYSCALVGPPEHDGPVFDNDVLPYVIAEFWRKFK